MNRKISPNDVILDMPKLPPHGGAELVHPVADDAAEVFVAEVADSVEHTCGGYKNDQLNKR
jgi:hypothetical protein